jgi:hypothetical protein
LSNIIRRKEPQKCRSIRQLKNIGRLCIDELFELKDVPKPSVKMERGDIFGIDRDPCKKEINDDFQSGENQLQKMHLNEQQFSGFC